MSTARWNPKGLAEKLRAGIDGSDPDDEPVGQRGDKVESALWRRRRYPFHPSNQGVCGRHGVEEHVVTPGDLIGCLACKERGAKAHL